MRLLLFCLFIINLPCFSQTLKGKFLYEGFGDGGRILTFNGHTFTDKTADHDVDLYGEGTYKIIANTLYLKYIKIINQDSFEYSVQSKATTGKDGYLSFKTLDQSGNPVRAMIVLVDQNLHSIATFYADKNGVAVLDVSPNTAAKYIKILYWLLYSATFKVASLVGKNSEISINFKPAEYSYRQPGQETYRIKKLAHDGFKLIGNDKQEYIFKKIN